MTRYRLTHHFSLHPRGEFEADTPQAAVRQEIESRRGDGYGQEFWTGTYAEYDASDGRAVDEFYVRNMDTDETTEIVVWLKEWRK